jgi:hypothetical protein
MPTGGTPFFLVYGAEAVLPPELKHGSPRVLAFDEARQDDSRGTDLVLLEEARRQAALRAARYQQALQHYHSRSIRPRTLEVGDLVLRRILSREGLHKLSPMWEGPFQGHPRLQARHRTPGDGGRGSCAERLEHPAPPQILPVTLSHKNEAGLYTPRSLPVRRSTASRELPPTPKWKPHAPRWRNDRTAIMPTPKWKPHAPRWRNDR